MIHYNSSNVNSEYKIQMDFSESSDLFTEMEFIPDVVINNAAIFKKDTDEDYRKVFEVNFFAPIRITQDFYTINPNGVVINILDSWALTHPKNFLNYALSKIALTDFTIGMKNQEIGSFKVVGVMLGATLFKEGQKREVFDKIPQTSVEDVCKAVDFVLSGNVQNGEILDLTKADANTVS